MLWHQLIRTKTNWPLFIICQQETTSSFVIDRSPLKIRISLKKLNKVSRLATAKSVCVCLSTLNIQIVKCGICVNVVLVLGWQRQEEEGLSQLWLRGKFQPHKTPDTKQNGYANVLIESMISLLLFCIFSCYQCLSIKACICVGYATPWMWANFTGLIFRLLPTSHCSEHVPRHVCSYTLSAGFPHKYKLPEVGSLSQGEAFTIYSQNAL